MIVRLSCPFCNTGFDREAVHADTRVACPRCGESFAVKGDPGALPGFSENGTAPSSAMDTQVPSAKLLRPVAVFAVLSAVAVAGIGLYLVFNKDSHPQPVDPPPKQAATMPPAAIGGLAYLPADTSVAFAVQPRPIATYAERTKTDPKELLLQVGVPPRLFAVFDQAGIKLEQIDHIVGGLILASDNPIPRMVFSITLVSPLADDDAFLKVLKAQKFTTAKGATRWKADLGGFPAEMVKPSDRGYVLATDGKDLDGSLGGRGSGHLSMGLRLSMEKLSPASVVWLATESARWDDKPAVKFVATLMSQPDLPARLANVRAVAIGISLEPDPKQAGWLRAPDAAASKKFSETAATTFAGKPVTIGEAGDWVSVESPFDPKQGLTSGVLGMLPKK